MIDVFLALALSLHGPAESAQAQVADPALARAQTAAGAFRQALRNTLASAIAQEGTAAAIAVCRERAPRLADEIGAAHGVRLGRVAVKGRERNPAQAAQGWLADALVQIRSALDAGVRASEASVVLRQGLPQGVSLRFVRGIETEATCLACHGTQIGADVAAALAANYPTDRATGFALGELRGLLWVEVPDPQARTKAADRSAP